jgi:hypothetical protein
VICFFSCKHRLLSARRPHGAFGSIPKKNLKEIILILGNEQLDAQFFIYMFISIQFNQLYQNNIWYVSLGVGDRLVCRSGRNSFPTCILDGHLNRVTHTRCCIDKIDSPGDEHEVAANR